jgi:hypothetical protein
MTASRQRCRPPTGTLMANHLTRGRSTATKDGVERFELISLLNECAVIVPPLQAVFTVDSKKGADRKGLGDADRLWGSMDQLGRPW